MLTPDMKNRLKAVLLSCDKFQSSRQLQTVFSDNRLIPWKFSVPEGQTVSERIDNTVDWLIGRYHRNGENALVVFLKVLGESIHYNDANYQKLIDLADEVSGSLQRNTSLPAPEPLALFGYFYVGDGEMEKKILMLGNDLNSFLMLNSFLPSEHTIEGAIEQLVLDVARQLRVDTDEFLRAGFKKPIHRRLYKSDKKNRTLHILPYIFFKVELQKDSIRGYGMNWRCCRWEDKGAIIGQIMDKDIYYGPLSFPAENKNLPDIFESICDEKIYKQFGFAILECVDILVFRINNDKKVEFLLIYRQIIGEPLEYWEYPKGGLHYHETYLEGAYRELNEETGLEPYQVSYCGDLGFQMVDVTERDQFYDALKVQGMIFYYEGDPKDIKLDPKHPQKKWFGFAEALETVGQSERIKDYALEFFRRWEHKAQEILQKCGERGIR
jgi:8-oxo-dGTP pyrophosphatase MutT (NUDIX family)